MTKKTSLQELVRKYNVISDSADACSGLTSGQFSSGDADVAKKKMGRLFTKQRSRAQRSQDVQMRVSEGS